MYFIFNTPTVTLISIPGLNLFQFFLYYRKKQVGNHKRKTPLEYGFLIIYRSFKRKMTLPVLMNMIGCSGSRGSSFRENSQASSTNPTLNLNKYKLYPTLLQLNYLKFETKIYISFLLIECYSQILIKNNNPFINLLFTGSYNT